MLVFGKINPSVINDPEYKGIYFCEKDNIPAKMASMSGAPLIVEHKTCPVGKVVSAWADKKDGCLYALAEIDSKTPGGYMAAVAVSSGRLGQFSMGYDATIKKDARTGYMEATNKQVTELSIVKNGARPDCYVMAKSNF